ncbi:MAG: energy transducer TonB [Synergistaceae bacterium]|nr:energy transducer TonB [Synergistaceae bacterium]
MFSNITKILKNKNFLAILISLIFHCLLFAFIGKLVVNHEKYTTVPVQLVAVKLPKNINVFTAQQGNKFNARKSSERSKGKTLTRNRLVNKAIEKNLSKAVEIGSDTTNLQNCGNEPEELGNIFGNEGKSESVLQEGNEEPHKVRELDAVVVKHKEIPRYPVFSRKMREEGTVLLLLTVKDGTVCSVSIDKSSGFSRLDSAAQIAAKKWIFSSDGNFMVKVPFSFKLSN